MDLDLQRMIDPLTEGVRMRRWGAFTSGRKWTIAAGTFAVLIAGLILYVARAPQFPSDAANGLYSHDCCGTIELRDGEMIANEVDLVSYVLGQDESGPYILPNMFVGPLNGGIELDGARPALKLRLDTIPHPNSLDLPDLRGSYRFIRRAPRIRFNPAR